MLESGDAFFDFAGIFVDEAEVVPGVGILRELSGRFLERRAGRLEFLLAEQRNAEVEARDREFWVGGERLLEIFLRVGEFLLIHVGDAEGVEPQGVGRAGGVALCGGRFRARCFLGARRSGAQRKRDDRANQ